MAKKKGNRKLWHPESRGMMHAGRTWTEDGVMNRWVGPGGMTFLDFEAPQAKRPKKPRKRVPMKGKGYHARSSQRGIKVREGLGHRDVFPGASYRVKVENRAFEASFTRRRSGHQHPPRPGAPCPICGV